MLRCVVGAKDLNFLKEMLFEAFFWDPSTKRPSFVSFRDHNVERAFDAQPGPFQSATI
jgi:hypothetical protein